MEKERTIYTNTGRTPNKYETIVEINFDLRLESVDNDYFHNFDNAFSNQAR